jgi:murein DD-endopeptidase MepM/ murein hydrolase activator NlpD
MTVNSNKFPALVQKFSASRIPGNSTTPQVFDNIVAALKDSPAALNTASTALTKLSASPGLLSIISLLRQSNKGLNSEELNMMITHLLVSAKSESNYNWFARNKSGHFGLLQHSKGNWDHSIKTIFTKVKETDGGRLLQTLAKDFGIPTGEIKYLDTKFGDTDSKFYQIPAAAGAVCSNWTHFSKQFTWSGDSWEPRMDSVVNSPRWKEIASKLKPVLSQKNAGAVSLLSLIHVNGPSWFTASKVRHQDRILADGQGSTAIATAPIVTGLTTQLKKVGLDKSLPTEKVVISPKVVAPKEPNMGGWLDTRSDGSKHYGVDYEAMNNTPIYAPSDGAITSVWGGDSDPGGNNARFVTPDGFQYVFAHLAKKPDKKRGEPKAVKAGDIIAYTGHSGSRKKDKHGHKTVGYAAHFHLSVRAPKGWLDTRPDAFAARHKGAEPFYNPNYAPIKPVSFLMRPDVLT